MTEQEREYMERYIYEAVKRVQKKQKKELELDLRELIEDMSETESVKTVLLKLGSPAEYARQYREDKGYVIGPEYYDNYVWLLKIVLACVAGAVVLSGILEAIFHLDVRMMAGCVGNLLMAEMTAFGAVTLLFAAMERQKIRLDMKLTEWNPSQLKPVPVKKARISRGDSIVGIIFIVIFGALLVFAPQLFGAFSVNGEEIQYVSVFNLEKWSLILPVFLASLFIGLADEVVKLAAGCYCRIVMVSSLISNILSMILAVILLKVLPFWNPDFSRKVGELFDIEAQNGGFYSFLQKWESGFFSNLLLVIIFAAALGEMAVTVYKTCRYGE